VLLPQQGCADFQGSEMQGHEDHALAVQLSLLEVLQAFDMGQARQTLARPPPAHGHFKEGDGTALLICLAALPLVTLPSLEVWGYVLISVVLNTVYRLFLIKAYETGDFGQVYPVMRGV
ncbi:hypothetical protein Q6257_27635, partial [Klebsiella variicola]|nr:hypothetical protein [Klebsiella variicola]